MADSSDVAVEGVDSAPVPAPEKSRMSLKQAGELVITQNKKPAEKLMQAVQDARKAAGRLDESVASATSANKVVLIDSMGHAGGFATSFMMLRSMRPYAPSVLKTSFWLFKALCKMEGLIAFVLFFTSLGYAAAVCCLPRFVNLCFAIIYKGPDAQGISLEKFTTWCLFYAFFLLGSGTVQQWMFVLGRTSLCNDFTRLLIHTKITLPKSIGGSEIAEMATGDVLALKSFWQGVHCGFRALCWAIVSALLVLIEVPALGGLMFGLGIFYVLAGLLYDVFCIEKSNFSTEEYVRASIAKVEMISRKKDLNAEEGVGSPEREVLDEIDNFHRSDLIDQHVHVYSRAVQNCMVLLSPILVLYLSNHLVQEGKLDAVDIGYVLCYLALGAWSMMAFNKNCNLIVENAARATRLVTFGNELADAELLKRKRHYREAAKKAKTTSGGNTGLGGENVLVYMGVKKAGIVIVLGALGFVFVLAAIYNCAAMKDHISCSDTYAVCSLEDVPNGPAQQWMILKKEFSAKRGCVFEQSDSKILFQCSNVMQKTLKGTYAFGTYGTIQVKFSSWVDNYRLLQRRFQLPSNGNANNVKTGGSSLGRRRLRQSVAGTAPVSNEYVIGLAPDAQYESSSAASVAPPEWTCSPSYYNAQDGCDCNCGASDPDCAIPGSYVFGCLNGEVCPNDTCEAPSADDADDSSTSTIVTSPEVSGLLSALAELVSPSPASSTVVAPALPATTPASVASSASTLPTTTAELVAAGWNAAVCNTAYFNAQDGCDCGCGYYDPDCDGMPNVGFYRMGASCLLSHDSCSQEGECVSSAVEAAANSTETLLQMMTPEVSTVALLSAEDIAATPVSTPDGNDVTEWTCSPSYYNAQDGCDCGCGIFDPDCLLPNQQFYGSGETCNMSSNSCNPTTATCEVSDESTAAPSPPPPPVFAVSAPPPSSATSLDSYGFTYGFAPSPPVESSSPPPPPPTPTPTPAEAAATAAITESTVTTLTSTSPPSTCFAVTDPVASGWNGPLSYYNANDGCDCGYGICDPDCNGQGTPTYDQGLWNCDLFGLASTWNNFRCVGAVCQPISASVAATNNCPCNIYAAGVCACAASTTSSSASPGSSSSAPVSGAGATPTGYCTSSVTSSAGGMQWSECATQAKNCSAWYGSYDFLYDHRNPIVGVADLSSCEQTECNKIGNKYCDAELNNAQCAYDGGDCCIRTTTNPYVGSGSSLDCQDPAAQIVESWESIRTVSIPQTHYQYWDHITKSILNISASFTVASGTFFEDALAVLYSDETKAMESTWGWDAEEKLGKVGVYDVAIPNYMNATALPIVLAGAHMDFHIDGVAGQFLNAYLDAPFDATLELIAPNDDSSAADPDLINGTLPNHAGAQAWEAALDESAPTYSAAACGEWFKDNCSCYACFCSCGSYNVLASEFAIGMPKSTQFLNHCIPEYNDPHGCNGAHTVHYDVYVDPGMSGVTLDLEMERSHGGNWPMIMELYSPMDGYQITDNKCEVRSDGVVECCWPYTSDCPPRYSDKVIGMAAGAMVAGGNKVLRNFVTEKGFYRVQTKSYGYGGGGYNLKISMTEGSGTALVPETMTYSNGGALSYGEVKFGNITYTGEQHAYTFSGTKGDLVFIHMGPEWVPSNNEAEAQCGRPYGTGKDCLDTFLALMSPSKVIEAVNHVNNRDRDLVGSTIGTDLISGNPWYYETATGQSGIATYKSVPHQLKETGTYTVYASGSTVRSQTGSRFNSSFKAVGEYYVQVLKVSEHASVEKQCASPPEGHDLDGCANYLWSVFSNEPRHARRHPQCEKYRPQSSPVGSHTESGQLSFVDHPLSKTGTYTLRVRSLINNCFGFAAVYCKPYAGPFDLKARVRDTENTGPPSYAEDPSPSPNSGIRKHLVPIGVTRVIQNSCDDTPTGVNSTEVCYSTTTQEKKCKDTYVNYSGMDMGDVSYYVADLAFNVTQGDVLCIRSNKGIGQNNGMMQLIDAAGNHMAAAEASARGVDNGMGIFGYKVAATQEMIARFEANDLSGTEVTVDLCPEEHIDANFGAESTGNLSGQDCSAYSEKFEWDACFANDPDIVVRGDNATFTNPSTEKILIGKLGMDIDTDVDRYYFEIVVDGTEPVFRYDTTSNSELEYAIGFATRSVKTDGWLGLDDQSFVFRSGRRYNDGGSSAYGEELYPGDIIGIAWDGVDRKLFFSKNGYWQSPSSCNFDLAGMKYNNFKEALCTRPTYDFSCDRRNPIAGMTWSYSAENTRYEYQPDPSVGVDPWGYDCCPIAGLNVTDPIQTNPANYDKPYPRCTYKAAWPGILGNKPSCCPGNPVPDGKCSYDGRRHDMWLHWNDWQKFKVDEVQGGKVAYPVVSGNRNMSYEINYGDKAFKYALPCGYRPFSDLAQTISTSTNTGTVTTNCWTCQGMCASYNVATSTCDTYVSGGPTFDIFKEWGMDEGGSEERIM